MNGHLHSSPITYSMYGVVSVPLFPGFFRGREFPAQPTVPMQQREAWNRGVSSNAYN